MRYVLYLFTFRIVRSTSMMASARCTSSFVYVFFLPPIMPPMPFGGIPPGIPPGCPAGLASALPPGIPPGCPAGLALALPPGMPPGCPAGLASALPPGIPPGCPAGLASALPPGMLPGCPAGLASALPPMPFGGIPGIPAGIPPFFLLPVIIIMAAIPRGALRSAMISRALASSSGVILAVRQTNSSVAIVGWVSRRFTSSFAGSKYTCVNFTRSRSASRCVRPFSLSSAQTP